MKLATCFDVVAAKQIAMMHWMNVLAFADNVVVI